MRTLAHPADLGRPTAGVCLALGMFDGVHLGHQHVVRQAVLDARALDARSVVATFHPHPLHVIAPTRAPRLLQSVSQRVRALSTLGIDASLVIPFTGELSRVSGEDFIRSLAHDFGRLRSVTVGQGFHFGNQRSGNVPLLESLGHELGFVTHAVAPIHIGAERVSSTRIRSNLREGRFNAVAELLGRPYAIAGEVVPGRQLGRQLGFPTANIPVPGLELPPLGVYAARVRIDPALPPATHPAVLNLGLRPTIDPNRSTPLLEVHLLDHSADLYGREIEVEFVRFIRAEKRFDSVDSLRAQIHSDLAAARLALG